MTDSPDSQSSEAKSPRVRVVSAPDAVPVYNCQALVAAKNSAGMVVARAANLPEASGQGASEREALQGLVTAFKAAVSRYAASGETIPWRNPPLPAQPNETQRWIAVHL